MNYSILINTCDKFEDCWNPFFKLWLEYWPDCNAPIFLNTEYKDFSYPGITINTIKGCKKHKLGINQKATWSQCLKWALESIDSDIILYLQEDYFLKGKVKNDIIEHYVKLMNIHQTIQCIHLTDQAVLSEGVSSYDTTLKKVITKQKYRVSCQAALWRKQELLSLIQEYESAWDFEEFASKRSGMMNHEYLVVDNRWVILDKFEIIPYIFTGIIQGKWYQKVIPLFKEHNINIDYNIRGFVGTTTPKTLRKRIKYRINKILKILRNEIILIKLMYKKS